MVPSAGSSRGTGGSRSGRVAALVFGLGIFGGACAHRAVLPEGPTAVLAPQAPAPLDLALTSFTLDGLVPVYDSDERVALVRHTFVDHMMADGRLRVRDTLDGGAPGASPRLRVTTHTERRLRLTGVLDLLTLPLGGVFAPWWGDVRIVLEAEVLAPGGERLATYVSEIQVPFVSLAYSWWKRDPFERPYREGYGAVFAALAKALGDDAERLRARLVSRETTRDEAPPARGVSPTAEETALPEPPADTPLARHLRLQPRPRFSAIYEERPLPAAPLARLLRILGGVELSSFGGVSDVSSSMRKEGGEREIARGTASQSGYRIALYSAPRTTGFVVYPTLGYLSQTIQIQDFAAYVEQPPGDIDAICSYPETGERFPCGLPNVYKLEISSGYLGLRTGYDLVFGSPVFALFVSATVGVNLLEYRSLRTRIGDYTDVGREPVFLRSGAFGLTSGIVLPKLHLALRWVVDREVYRTFRYAQPREFRGPVTYDATTQRYVRPRTFVDAARLETWSFQGAIAYVF